VKFLVQRTSHNTLFRDARRLFFSQISGIFQAVRIRHLNRNSACPYFAVIRGGKRRIEHYELLTYSISMKTMRYIYWQDENMWLGYLEEFPDYMSQGESLEELQENLKDIYQELTSGNIPGVRKIAELQLA